MAISRLNLVSINFDKYRYNEVLLKLFSHDDFHPELASKFIDSVTDLVSIIKIIFMKKFLFV